jgi:hypothetical protein
MVTEFNYIRVEELLSRVLRHPLMQSMDYETGIQYTIDFLQTVGFPQTYIEKYKCLEIEDYRALMPEDLIQIIQVKDTKSNRYLRSMSSSIYDSDKASNTYKTQGNIIYTSFKDGNIEIYYRAIPIDENGAPLIPDNSIFLKTLELYIKKEWFTILFDTGKINAQVLQNVQQEYSFKVAQCTNMFIIPSVSETQTITKMLNNILPSNKQFEQGFKHIGNK